MASEQARTRKKQAKDTSKGDHCPSVLYRHQDCIPNTKLLQSCDRYNLLGLKIDEGVGCCKKSTKEQPDLNNQQNTIKQANVTSTVGFKSKLAKISTQQANGECSNEELSKSRKRRLRKQRLLESLAPPLNNCIQPNPALGSNLKTKLVSHSSAQSSSVPLSSVVTDNKSIEPTKLSPKDSRKRLDKSVALRVKSNIKSKTLVESHLNQSKANLIKSLEGKTLNSLLQTLVPLGNSSTNKDKKSSPKFSFQEKQNNHSDSKVSKDGVFYFGETKHQLEKLATGLNKNSSSNLFKDSSESAQKIKPSKNICFPSNSGSTENCFSSFKFSPTSISSDIFSTDSLKSDKQTILLPSRVENSTFISRCQANEQLCSSESSVQNLSSFPKVSFSSPVVCAPFSSNGSIVDTTKSFDKTTTVPEKNQQQLVTGFNKAEQVSLIESDRKAYINTMKSSEEVNKSNKTREEVMLEREAKKAAKIAAKVKHKTPQNNKADSNTSSSNILTTQNKELVIKTKKIDTQTPLHEIKDEVFQDVSGNLSVHLGNAITEKASIVSFSKDNKQEPAGKSKAELRAERRAKQETQRAAKTIGKTSQNQPKDRIPADKNVSKSITSLVPLEKKSDMPTTAKIPTQAKPKMFSHLFREKPSLTSNHLLLTKNLHPAIVRLGVQYSRRVVAGSNSRCVALLHALKQVVKDYTTPLEKEFSRGLEEELGSISVFLDQCRPLAVSMTNALRHIKRTLTQLPNNIPDIEARRKICDVVDTYIHEQIDVAGEAICNRVIEKISDGDVILTYGCSSLVYQILVKSHLKGTKFSVVIVDGLPWREGREMLRRLVDKGLSCTYVLITAASFIMREASKVLLGAHALLANGYVMARAGSSQVALLAHCNNVPVLVCCETHKFCERVQTDAFVYNELGEISCENIKDKEKMKVLERLTPLSLAYDITPPDLVSAVVTELAVLPCTSVPVILRIKPSDSVM